MRTRSLDFILAAGIAAAMLLIDASPSRAGPCFRWIGNYIVYTCPLPGPPYGSVPQPSFKIAVSAGPNSGMGTYGAENVFITATYQGKPVTGYVDMCTLVATGGSLTGESPYKTSCVAGTDFRLPCLAPGTLSVVFTNASTGSAISNTSTVGFRCGPPTKPLQHPIKR